MELWDIYDKDRVLSGKTMIRGADFALGDYHLAIHICLFNPNGQMLIQQRQPFKDGWPNLWDFTAAGSAVAGDSSGAAAERELMEEIGFHYDFSLIRPQFTINYEFGFDDYYLIHAEPDLSSLTLQPEEVQCVKWAEKAEIKEMIRAGSFIPYYEDLVDLCFSMRGKYGSHVV
ncbi:MAG: NUDIX domain-containing protein [Anaerofustis sp.]